MSWGMHELDVEDAELEGVAVIDLLQVTVGDAGDLFQTGRFVFVHKERDCLCLEESSDALHLHAPEVSTDVIRMVVGHQSAGDSVTILTGDLQQRIDVPGGIYDEGLPSFWVT